MLAPEKPSPFQRKRFHFTTGLRAGLLAQIRDDDGRVLLTYRSFASVVGIVAALMSGIVLVAGIAAVLFLVAEKRPIPAVVALVLSVGFAVLIAMLVPRTHVTLHNDNALVLTVAQISRAAFPSLTFAVATPDGRVLALLRKSFLSRLGRNRWSILDPDTRRTTGSAIEESLGRAYRRKLLAKFNRRNDANVRVRYEAADIATIVRRPDEAGRVDVLELASDALDARVAVGLALLVLGSEP